MTVAITSTVLGMAVPASTRMLDSVRLNGAARDVERELQTARLRAVSVNRPLRVRFNCPAVGQFRIVEVLGSSIDMASNRCDPKAYPYPDNDPEQRPNADGPVREIRTDLKFAPTDLEFSPDGRTRQVASGVAQAISSQVSITVSNGYATKTITINGLGKILMQ